MSKSNKKTNVKYHELAWKQMTKYVIVDPNISEFEAKVSSYQFQIFMSNPFEYDFRSSSGKIGALVSCKV